MSKNFKNSTASLRGSEVWGGAIFWPFYVLLTALLVNGIFQALGIRLNNYQLNIIVIVVDFIAIIAIFHRFLWDSLRAAGHSFWLLVQAVILALAMYYALYYAYGWLTSLAHLDYINSNNDAVMTLLRGHFTPMVLSTCLLIPVIEECLCRGLLFGMLHQKNRILAYCVSMLVFAALHIWQYAGSYTLGNLLLVAIAYLPAGLALGWAYEKSGNIWASIVTHSCINFISCYVTIFVSA